MDKNNSSSSSSSSSVCSKIRQALSSNPAFKAVQRITSFNQEQEPNKPLTKNPNSPSSNDITNISIQSKLHPHHKPHTQGPGAIPIKFDHSSPKLSDHNGKKSSVTTSVAEGAPSERATKVPAKGKPHHVSMQGKQHGQVVHYSEPRGKKQADINDNFKEFIENTKEKMMRSVTNIGNWGQSNHYHHEAHGSNKNESHFSEFIQTVRKKLRTTTTVRKSGSVREKWYKCASLGLTVFGAYIAKHAIRYILERWRRSELQKRVLAAAAKKSEQNNDVEKADSLSEGAKRDRLMPDLCVICLEHEYNAVFVPCGHMCCCIACSSHLTNCPLCRRQIEKVMGSIQIVL